MEHEGGYAHRASDLGGETWRGISRKNWPGWPGWKIIDRLKEPGDSVEDIDATLGLDASLPELVQKFYFKNFWKPLNCDHLPQSIAAELFDTGVNQGVGTAGKYLQKAVNYLNNNGKIFKDITQDGAVGPMTLAAFDAARLYWSRYGARVFNRTFIKILDGLQFERYASIVEDLPGQEVNFFGWINNRIGNVG